MRPRPPRPHRPSRGGHQSVWLYGHHPVLAALANRGHAVLEGPVAVDACAPLANIFRVSLGPPPDGGRSFHLVLCPELFSERSMPAIIGDTYLEWAATREMADTV